MLQGFSGHETGGPSEVQMGKSLWLHLAKNLGQIGQRGASLPSHLAG